MENFSYRAEFKYGIKILNGITTTDKILYDIYDDVCRSGCGFGIIDVSFNNYTSSLEGNTIIESGEIRDPLYENIKTQRINYDKLCSVCNHQYSRYNYTTCEKCVTGHNISDEMKEIILHERDKSLIIPLCHIIKDTTVVCDENDDEIELEYELILISSTISSV
jgi:hypothetical protein